MSEISWLWTLFSSSFLSATLLPGNSEVLLITLVVSGNIAYEKLIIIATIGNTLGGLTNVMIGRFASSIKPHKHLDKALIWLRRYGAWTLLLSWLPVIGDLLCLLAGWLKLPYWSVIIAISIGKLLRYVVITIMALQGIALFQ